VKVPNGVKWRGGLHHSAVQTGVKIALYVDELKAVDLSKICTFT